MKIPCVKKPCKECPYRTDSAAGWLGRNRVTEFLGADTDSFVCHKNPSLQCAGHMIIKGNENAFVRFAAANGVDLGLKGHDLIFKSKQACIDHHDHNNFA